MSGTTRRWCAHGAGSLVGMEPNTTTSSPAPSSIPAPPPPAPPTPDPWAGNGTERAGPAARPRFTLRRSRTDRMIGGVCGGLAESLGVDAAMVRLGLVALTVLGAGSGVVLYLAAWILAPEAETA